MNLVTLLGPKWSKYISHLEKSSVHVNVIAILIKKHQKHHFFVTIVLHLQNTCVFSSRESVKLMCDIYIMKITTVYIDLPIFDKYNELLKLKKTCIYYIITCIKLSFNYLYYL